MRKLLVLVGACLGILAAILAWSWASRAPGRDVSPRVQAAPQPTEASTELEKPEAFLDAEARRDAVVAGTASDAGSTGKVQESDATESTALSILARSEETGEPIQGVRMLLWPVPDEDGFSITWGKTSSERFGTSPVSDEHGRARIEVPADRAFRLTTQSDAAGPARLEVEPLAVGEQRELELKLPTGTDLHFVGRVVADESGAPLPDARVRVGHLSEIRREPRGAEDSETGANASTEPASTAGRTSIPVDQDGYFELDLNSWLQQIVRVEAPRYAWLPVVPSEGHGTRDTAREVRLRRGAVVEAHVVARGPLVLEGIDVVLSAEYHQMIELQSMNQVVFSRDPARWSARTDALGRCRIEGLPPGVSFDLSARPRGENSVKLPDKLALEPGETRAIEIELGGGAALRGWLQDIAGAPVQGAQVWLMARKDGGARCILAHERDSAQVTRTDASGRFQYEQVHDGEWLVGCEPDGPFAPATAVVVVAQGLADSEPRLTADGSLFIRGRVLGPDNRPVQANVFAVGGESGCYPSGNCEADGSFSLGPLVRGSYALSAMHWGEVDGIPLTQSKPVQAEAGASDVILTLQHGGVISGRVVDPLTGRGVEVDVMAANYGTPEQDGGLWIHSSSEDGSFRIDGLAVGTYALSARTSGVQVAVRTGVQLVAGQEVTDVILSLEPGARLRIRYDGSAAHCGVRVLLDGMPVAGDGLAKGNDTTFVVPAGALSVECTEYSGTTGSSRSKSVEVAVGGLASVEFGRED